MNYPTQRNLGGVSRDESFATALKWIIEFVAMNGVSPTVRECGAGWGVSRGTAHNIINDMVEAGLIAYTTVNDKRVNRGLVIPPAAKNL